MTTKRSLGLHDGEIRCLRSVGRALELEIATPGGGLGVLRFDDVWAWRLSPFEQQNVLFQVSQRPAATAGSDAQVLDWWDAEECRAFPEGARVFLLEASVGLDGSVVARRAMWSVASEVIDLTEEACAG